MDGVLLEPEHPKKRRRRNNQRPLSARLVLDDTLDDSIGVVSEDLWIQLVPERHEYGMGLVEI